MWRHPTSNQQMDFDRVWFPTIKKCCCYLFWRVSRGYRGCAASVCGLVNLLVTLFVFTHVCVCHCLGIYSKVRPSLLLVSVIVMESTTKWVLHSFLCLSSCVRCMAVHTQQVALEDKLVCIEITRYNLHGRHKHIYPLVMVLWDKPLSLGCVKTFISGGKLC